MLRFEVLNALLVHDPKAFLRLVVDFPVNHVLETELQEVLGRRVIELLQRITIIAL